jgi:two-component system sensor histidine kinase KdpD
VFDRFYTVSRAAKRHVGSGLGLAIVHELVDAMGGSVRAEPGANGGARLVVTLRPGAEATAA